MFRVTSVASGILLFVLMVPVATRADIKEVAKCQKKFASAGANFAKRVIRANLKCTTGISLCQIQCEQGVFGPPCSSNPPPCCDPDDVNSNNTYKACMTKADMTCTKQISKIANWEAVKQVSIIEACHNVTADELCGSADMAGLNYKVLAAGCEAVVPGFVCDIWNLIDCVGGPLERQLADQISALLDARSGAAIGALGIEDQFPGIPRERKTRAEVADGTMDVWAIEGFAGEEFMVRVDTRNDNGDGTTSLQPVLFLLDRDGQAPVEDTNVLQKPCPVVSTCGDTCPSFSRRLPFSGRFYLTVGAQDGPGCAGGRYKLVVRSPRGERPVLLADDVPPGTFQP